MATRKTRPVLEGQIKSLRDFVLFAVRGDQRIPAMRDPETDHVVTDAIKHVEDLTRTLNDYAQRPREHWVEEARKAKKAKYGYTDAELTSWARYRSMWIQLHMWDPHPAHAKLRETLLSEIFIAMEHDCPNVVRLLDKGRKSPRDLDPADLMRMRDEPKEEPTDSEVEDIRRETMEYWIGAVRNAEEMAEEAKKGVAHFNQYWGELLSSIEEGSQFVPVHPHGFMRLVSYRRIREAMDEKQMDYFAAPVWGEWVEPIHACCGVAPVDAYLEMAYDPARGDDVHEAAPHEGMEALSLRFSRESLPVLLRRLGELAENRDQEYFATVEIEAVPATLPKNPAGELQRMILQAIGIDCDGKGPVPEGNEQLSCARA